MALPSGISLKVALRAGLSYDRAVRYSGAVWAAVKRTASCSEHGDRATAVVHLKAAFEPIAAGLTQQQCGCLLGDLEATWLRCLEMYHSALTRFASAPLHPLRSDMEF